MLNAITRFARILAAWKGVFRLLREAGKLRGPSVAFYAEDGSSRPHLDPILRQLLGEGVNLFYLTSSREDPILLEHLSGLKPIFVGSGVSRTFLFYFLNVDVLVMTMPDLESFHIKRSRGKKVRYIYVFHSIVSTHMVYRKGAFDHFDVILAVGPHHLLEVRAFETALGLPPKEIVEHGYGRLDSLLAAEAAGASSRSERLRVLIAPSWGPQSILESTGPEWIEPLLQAGFDVIVRPHPATRIRHPSIVGRLRERFSSRPGFSVDEDMSDRRSLLEADILITDWSGTSMEYAFSRERPVIFVDVPRKVNNPDYEELNLVPKEVELRQRIGIVVPLALLGELPERIRETVVRAAEFRGPIIKARNETVFNLGKSGKVGADWIRVNCIKKYRG